MRTVPSLFHLDARLREPEAVDDNGLETRRLFGALRGMERLQRWSGSARILWSPLRALWHTMPTKPLRVLDVAAGPGTTALQLWKSAGRAGCKVTVDGCEKHPGNVELARRAALMEGAPMRFHSIDAASSELPSGYDVLLASLFLHRLSDAGAVELLQHMASKTRSMLIVQDPLRCFEGLRLARLAARCLHSPAIVLRDVERAVRAGYTLEEVRRLADRAGLQDAHIERVWPHRFVLTWSPSGVHREFATQRTHTGRERFGQRSRIEERGLLVPLAPMRPF